MKTIEERALAAADPFAKQTFAQRIEHLADVVTYIEENYPALKILRAETTANGLEQIHIYQGSEVIRWLGPVTMRAQSANNLRLETKFKGVTIFTLTESYAP
jgi:hypothetical protein